MPCEMDVQLPFLTRGRSGREVELPPNFNPPKRVGLFYIAYSQRRSDIRVSSGRVCIILYGYNGARDEKTKWRRRKFPSGISPE